MHTIRENSKVIKHQKHRCFQAMLSAFLLPTDINLIKLFIGLLFSLELFFLMKIHLGKNLGTYLSSKELQSRSNLRNYLVSAILCHERLGKKKPVVTPGEL